MLVTSFPKIMTFISKYFYFHSADIIKIVTMFIKIIFKDSKKVKRIGHYVSKCNLYLYFLIYQNLLIPFFKMMTSAELKECVR